MIRRRHTHLGDPVEGTMEVTEFEENHAMGVVIREGDMEMPSRVVAEPVGPDQTRIGISADFPGLDDPDAASELEGIVQGTADTIKELIESET